MKYVLVWCVLWAGLARADEFARQERLFGLPPGLLAAVYFVESSNGTLQGNYRGIDVWDDTQRYYAERIAAEIGRDLDLFLTSSAGAMGPFQIMPGTWWRKKQDGNGDGLKDPYMLHDAMQTAAYYLARQIALLGLDSALVKYSGGARGYVLRVAQARR